MRDVIWTIIIIWVVYKLVDLFRGTSVKKTFVYNKYEYHSNTQNTSSKPEGSVTVEAKANQSAKQPKANATDGEYVDFEEIK